MEYFVPPRVGGVVNLLVDADTAEAPKTESQHLSNNLGICMVGPRDAPLGHAIVSQNLDFSHMIIGPRHGHRPDGNGEEHRFYQP